MSENIASVLCPDCGKEVPKQNYCGYCGIELDGGLPREGSLFFHIDSADSVVSQSDWEDVERGSAIEEALRDFMYEVEVEVRVTEDYKVQVLAVNGEEVVSEE